MSELVVTMSSEASMAQTIETTPKVVESCEGVDQSVNATQHPLAHTLNTSATDDHNQSLTTDDHNETLTTDDHNQSLTTDDHNQSLTTDSEPKSGNKMTPKEHKEDVKRRRTRRSKKRKWQRLEWRHKRLWTESTEHEVKRLHMKVVEHGQPLAPYNTTQFIMNDHNCDKEIDFDAIRGRLQRLRHTQHNDNTSGATAANVDDNDEDFYSSPEDESDYLQQQFDEAYDHIHAERLSQMTKNQLVDEYLQLEDRVEDLEKRLKESTPTLRTTCDSEVQTERYAHDLHSDDTDVHKRTLVLQQELQTLSEENHKLRCDNERLERIARERDIPFHSTPDQ